MFQMIKTFMTSCPYYTFHLLFIKAFKTIFSGDSIIILFDKNHGAPLDFGAFIKHSRLTTK